MKLLKCLTFAACVALLPVITSCAPADEEELQGYGSMTKEQMTTAIIGHWVNKSTSEHWRYQSTGYGVKWDPTEDVQEQEGQKFKWEINATGLLHSFYQEMTGSYVTHDPDSPYIIESITASSMVRKTSGGIRETLTKQ